MIRHDACSESHLCFSICLVWRATRFTLWLNLSLTPPARSCDCLGGCCRACQAYSGVSFKGRRPVMYGRITTVTPGPTGV